MENSDESIISGLGDTSSNSSVSDISDSTLSAEIYLSSTEVSSKIIMDLQNKFYFEKLPLKVLCLLRHFVLIIDISIENYYCQNIKKSNSNICN